MAQIIIKEKPMIRICESEWHKLIELKPLEECPICHSVAYHRNIPLDKFKEINKNDN